MSRPKMSVSAALAWARARLRAGGVPEAGVNAEWLLARVLDCSRPALALSLARRMPAVGLRRLRRLVSLRARRAPLAYVLGSQPFLGLELKVGPGVLVPRPETEELAQTALELARGLKPGARLLDAGTGSGCLALALAAGLPGARVEATDISVRALAVARANACRLGLSGRVRFARRNFFRRLGGPGRYHLIVSNPPYIPSPRLRGLQAEVRREPREALDGGPDGLAALEAIIRSAPACLKPAGALALEFGLGQGRRVAALLRAAGFTRVELRADAQGVERLAVARLAPAARS